MQRHVSNSYLNFLSVLPRSCMLALPPSKVMMTRSMECEKKQLLVFALLRANASCRDLTSVDSARSSPDAFTVSLLSAVIMTLKPSKRQLLGKWEKTGLGPP